MESRGQFYVNHMQTKASVSTILKYIAGALTIGGVLTVGGLFYKAGTYQDNGVVYVLPGGATSSTPRIVADGNAGSITSTGINFTDATGTDLTLTNYIHVSSTTGIPFGPPGFGLTAGAIIGISDWITQSNLVFVNSGIKNSYGFTNYIAEAGDTGSGTEVYFFVQASSSDIGFGLFPSESVVAGNNSTDPNTSRFYRGMDTNGYMAIMSSLGPQGYDYSNMYDIGANGVAMRNIYASGTIIGVNQILSGNSTTTGRTASGGGSAGKAICWKADGVTLGYCSSLVGAGGDCTCL